MLEIPFVALTYKLVSLTAVWSVVSTVINPSVISEGNAAGFDINSVWTRSIINFVLLTAIMLAKSKDRIEFKSLVVTHFNSIISRSIFVSSGKNDLRFVLFISGLNVRLFAFGSTNIFANESAYLIYAGRICDFGKVVTGEYVIVGYLEFISLTIGVIAWNHGAVYPVDTGGRSDGRPIDAVSGEPPKTSFAPVPQPETNKPQTKNDPTTKANTNIFFIILLLSYPLSHIYRRNDTDISLPRGHNPMGAQEEVSVPVCCYNTDMSLKLGIVGLPNVGKSTLFNCLSNGKASVSNYAFTTIDPNVGVVEVPDERVDKLTQMCSSKKKVKTTIEFVDIAGLVKGASKGEGLGNKFLANIREVDAIVHVVRCFQNADIMHVEGDISPARDIDIINMELLLADLSTVEKRIDSVRKGIKSGDKAVAKEFALLEKIKTEIEKGLLVNSITFKEDEKEIVKTFNLMTSKPMIYAANIDEDSAGVDTNDFVKEVEKIAGAHNTKVVTFCAKLESELKDLSEDEARKFLDEMGVKESGLSKLIKEGYSILDLITFLTAGEKETRAWTCTKGSKAPQAAGKIHTDFEKGFIAAEVISNEDLLKCGSFVIAKEKGLIRLEGRDYEVKDGDVVVFRFNV